MIDLHCHLLPEVDDGAKSINDSLALLKMAHSDGIKHIVLTPHIHPERYGNSKQSLRQPFINLQQRLSNEGLDLHLSIAGEVRLSTDIVTMYNQDNLPYLGTYHNRKVMLLEFPHDNIPVGSDRLIDWLLQRDILPMIAHPERNKAIMHDIKKATPLLERGCLFQLTAMSVCGKFGERAHKIAHTFIQNEWASVIASDAHHLIHRPPVLSEAFQHVTKLYGLKQAEQLMQQTPAEILYGK